MIFALAKFSAFLSEFNRRKLGEADFFSTCERENITVVFAGMPLLQGFTARLGSQNYIFLDQNLRGTSLLLIAFHELAHYVLHEPRTKRQTTDLKYYRQCRPSKEDDEADAVALVCLYPTAALEAAVLAPADEDCELLSRRLLIYRQFGI